MRLVAVALLAGACGRIDFAPLPANTFLVVGNGSNVNVFMLDTLTGAATPTGQGAFGIGEPNVIGATPDGRFVYVPDSNDMALAGYAVDPIDGALTPIPGTPIATGHLLQAARVVPSGRFLYVPTGEVPGSVLAYSIDASTGELVSIGEFDAGGTGTYFPVIDPTGSLLYISSYETTFPGYQIDGTNGALTMLPGFPIAAQGANLAVALDPAGVFLYMGSNTVDLRGYQIGADGALTQVPGSPYDFPQDTYWLEVDPSGRYLLVGVLTAGGDSEPGLYVWARDPSTGAITQTAASPYTIGQTSCIVFSPDGRFVYATTYNGSTTMLVQLAFDASAGSLTELASWPLTGGLTPSMVVVQPPY
jgi:6-phosphogluconolactonase (cycloisomerase 2 family)